MVGYRENDIFHILWFDFTLEGVVKIKQRKERWGGCGMQKQVSYISFFPFHLSPSLFPFGNLF
jgi:hypothetical protein